MLRAVQEKSDLEKLLFLKKGVQEFSSALEEDRLNADQEDGKRKTRTLISHHRNYWDVYWAEALVSPGSLMQEFSSSEDKRELITTLCEALGIMIKIQLPRSYEEIAPDRVEQQLHVSQKKQQLNSNITGRAKLLVLIFDCLAEAYDLICQSSDDFTKNFASWAKSLKSENSFLYNKIKNAINLRNKAKSYFIPLD